jgi:hypothetical protein
MRRIARRQPIDASAFALSAPGTTTSQGGPHAPEKQQESRDAEPEISGRNNRAGCPVDFVTDLPVARVRIVPSAPIVGLHNILSDRCGS